VKLGYFPFFDEQFEISDDLFSRREVGRELAFVDKFGGFEDSKVKSLSLSDIYKILGANWLNVF
jgi:hypothetical protein